MAQIICLGDRSWSTAQSNRTAQLLTRIDQFHDILYFEPSPPMLQGLRTHAEHHDTGRKVRSNITVYRLPPTFAVDGLEHPRIRSYNDRRLLRFISDKCSKEGFYHPLLWVTDPGYAPILDRMENKGILYDCFRFWDEYDPHWESLLANRADVIFAASPLLVDHVEPCNTNIALLPNGCNTRLYEKVSAGTPMPRSMMSLPGPILGCLGDVPSHIDLEPIITAAREYPRWSFVFAGRCSRKNPAYEQVRGIRNIHFLGKIDPIDLPAYAVNMDVLLDLPQSSDPDDDVVPSRMYEYLLAGRPIAALYPRHLVPAFSDVVYGAHSVSEFLGAVYQAVMENSTWSPSRRRQYGLEADWTNRSKELQQILEQNGLL